ncbi:MAG: hypothetical protein AVDCRST_MAG34-1215, partial [uncultured Nocardioidaceae bacterium]
GNSQQADQGWCREEGDDRGTEAGEPAEAEGAGGEGPEQARDAAAL